MDGSEWRSSTDLVEMLDVLESRGLFSERKARLFLASLCRSIWDLVSDERSRKAVNVAERFADHLATREELETAHSAADSCCTELPAWGWPSEAAAVAANASSPRAADAACTAALDAKQARSTAGRQDWSEVLWYAEELAQAHLLRDLFFNPFLPTPLIAPSVLAWEDGLVVRMATAIYDDRQLPSGHLDPHRLAVLADALEDAGSGDAELPRHLRSEGPHYRGCFAVDLLRPDYR